MSLANAFNLLLALHGRNVTIERPGVTPKAIAPVAIRITNSNYSRKLEAVDRTVVEGREFVISKKILDEAGFPRPRRADRIVDAEEGAFVISEVEEMYDLGGATMGYRVRTS